MNKLSIITINRNNAEGLNTTMKSVFQQSFKDYEYIVVDGASTDSSVNTIRAFEFSEHKKFSWISEPDSGVFNAMNKGIQIATGEYLLFLNSGDFLVDNWVFENVFKEPVSEDILCGRCHVSDNGKIVFTTNPPEKLSLRHFYRATIAHQATFIKKSVFEKYGLYREDLKLMSDWEFFLRTIILENVSTRKLEIVISDYNLDGISSDKNNKELSDLECENVFSELGLQNIVPDYKIFIEERSGIEMLNWLKSQPLLYKIIICLNKVSIKIFKR